MYTTKNLQEDMKSLDFEGFKFNKEIMGFSWIQDEGTKINKIIIGYRGYPGGFYSYTPSVSITFPKVETFLNNLVEKFKINQGYGNDTIQAKLYPLEGIDYTVFETKIHDEGSFQIVAEEIKKIIVYGALPFWGQYSTLEKIHDHAIILNEEDYPNFFIGNGTIKLMIIKKLLNKPDYTTYSEKMVKDWTQYAKDYPQHFKNYDKLVIDLKEKLDEN